MSDAERPSVERADGPALEELRRAFEDPGEQFIAEIDDSVKDSTETAMTLTADASGASGAPVRPRTGRRWGLRKRPRTGSSRGGGARNRPGRSRAVDDLDLGLGGDHDPLPMVRVIAAGTAGSGADPATGPVGEPADQTPTSGVTTDGATDGIDDAPDIGGVQPDAGRIITIEDHDQPDLVYLEGRLEASDAASGGGGAAGSGLISDPEATATRHHYVIEDDEIADPVHAIDGSMRRGSPIEPRIRHRRVEVRRAIGRRRLRIVIIAVAAVIVVVGALAVLGSSLFGVRADQVTVIGAVYTDREALDAIIDDLVGQPTLTLDTAAAENRLRTIAWVDEARVRAVFPHQLTIDLRERVPLATFMGPDGRFRVIDRYGRVLDVLNGEPVAYMRLEVADVDNLAQAQFTTRGPAAAAELVQSLTPGIRQRVRLIEVTADGSQLTVVMNPWDIAPDGPVVRVNFGATTDLLVKLVRLEAVLATAAERRAEQIDVSTVEVSIR